MENYFLFIPQSELLAPFIGRTDSEYDKTEVLVVQEGDPTKHWAHGAGYGFGGYIKAFLDEGDGFYFDGISGEVCSLANEVGELVNRHDLQAEFHECMKLAGNERGDILAARISKFCKDLVAEFEQNKIDEQAAEEQAASDAQHPQR